ncbi:S66 peptidase family protein [Actinokineospora bangkokensis]|uniref:LD-carboxypeptidase n=1 Tax=Actinokineospora bangkokensis TaxID=1193682 RepID=A0A1Q9LP45_9PSEU|nr:LD-carboxypeptidase [Actinokineospora bangkokensis]OLR93816.1 LD-carboxypeptidase [Actinokineospora bangkokensis]
MSRTAPRRLRPGDTVAVIAPAGPVTPEQLAEGVAVLESWELDVRVGEHVLDRHPDLPYLAGRDADRAADFRDAWCDPRVAAVFCARGGYGSHRMVDLLDWPALAEAGPKLLVGSSDTTALHTAVGQTLDLVTLFAPMISTRAFDAEARRHLHATLFHPEEVTTLIGPATTSTGHERAEGVLVGGNLSLLAAEVGTLDALPPPDGSILLLEDVDEQPYRIDGMLTHLLRAGWFTGVGGIALGSWQGCGELAEVKAVAQDLLASLGVPVLWELGFGHCPNALTVPLGATAVLDPDDATLTLKDPALS